MIAILLRRMYGVVPVEPGTSKAPPELCIQMDSKPFSISANKNSRPKAAFLLAEMEGFEPPHALRRLADFESAPFSHLGTSPKTLVL